MFKPSPKSPGNNRRSPRLRSLILPALPLLLAACATAPQRLQPAPVPAPTIPPLPLELRQIDSPTQLHDWQKLVEGLLQPPTVPLPAGSGLKAPTIR